MSVFLKDFRHLLILYLCFVSIQITRSSVTKRLDKRSPGNSKEDPNIRRGVPATDFLPRYPSNLNWKNTQNPETPLGTTTPQPPTSKAAPRPARESSKFTTDPYMRPDDYVLAKLNRRNNKPPQRDDTTSTPRDSYGVSNLSDAWKGIIVFCVVLLVIFCGVAFANTFGTWFINLFRSRRENTTDNISNVAVHSPEVQNADAGNPDNDDNNGAAEANQPGGDYLIDFDRIKATVYRCCRHCKEVANFMINWLVVAAQEALRGNRAENPRAVTGNDQDREEGDGNSSVGDVSVSDAISNRAAKNANAYLNPPPHPRRPAPTPPTDAVAPAATAAPAEPTDAPAPPTDTISTPTDTISSVPSDDIASHNDYEKPPFLSKESVDDICKSLNSPAEGATSTASAPTVTGLPVLDDSSASDGPVPRCSSLGRLDAGAFAGDTELRRRAYSAGNRHKGGSSAGGNSGDSGASGNKTEGGSVDKSCGKPRGKEEAEEGDDETRL